MPVRFVFALLLALIGIMVYYFVGKRYKKERENWQKSLKCMGSNVDSIIANGLPLAGVSIDENSDPKVSDVIKTIRLSDDIRIKVYD